MSLKTVVKAGNITNLSDARYFAGMGVEIIGFPVGKSSGFGLEPTKIKEIAGWLAGIKIALELQEADFEEEWIKELLKELPPDYIQIPQNLVERFRKIADLPLLIVTSELPSSLQKNDCIVFTGKLLGNSSLQQFCAQHPVILSGEEIDAESVLKLLTSLKPYGLELKGGSEISPGLKDFEALSEILELLEVDE